MTPSATVGRAIECRNGPSPSEIDLYPCTGNQPSWSENTHMSA